MTPKPQAKTELTVDELLDEIFDNGVEVGGDIVLERQFENNLRAYKRYRTRVTKEAKQALLDWHNKEQVKLLERLKEKKFDYTTSEDDSSEEYSIDVVPVSAIQSELTKLKGGVK